MISKTSALLLSIWGWVCIFGTLYYTSLYFREPGNPARGEYWEGVGLTWGFGLITWLALPTLTILNWRVFGKTRSIVLNIPVAVAIIYFLVYVGAIFVST